MFNSSKKKKGSSGMKASQKKNQSQGNNLSSVNMVSEGTEIIGTLKTQSDIRIAGKVDGEAQVQGKIIVASTGHIDGNIDSEDADVAGRVKGEIHVSSKLSIRQSAVVEGDLYAQSLVVEEGATFNGACHMRDYASQSEPSTEENGSSASVENAKAVSP